MATATASDSVMKRKLAAARQGERDGTRSALRALRLALARAAADEAGLALAVIGATQGRCALENMPSLLAGDRLHLLLDGPDGRSGGFSLDRACTSALVQQQTTGRVGSGEPAARRFTATDAALVAPVVDGLMARAAALAESATDRLCLEGYRFGARMEDLRALVLALDADRFRVFDLTVEIAPDLRQGRLCLVLPDLSDGAPGEDPATAPGPGLEQSFGVLRAELMAVIGRLRVPLSKLSRMQPGETLELTQGRIDQTDLVAINGRKVAQGRLGQTGGLRAVRLAGASPTPPETTTVAGDDFAPARPATGQSTALARITPQTAPEAQQRAAQRQESEEFERHLLSLSPEQAAMEISQLAGLTPEEDGKDGEDGDGGGPDR